jgi:hypothetical protein
VTRPWLKRWHTFKLEFMYFASSSNLTIFSRASSYISCFCMNQGVSPPLTSSGILERHLVLRFIITHVLFYLCVYLNQNRYEKREAEESFKDITENVTNLVARAKIWPVALLLISHSRHIPFFPDVPTHVSISSTSPMSHVKCIPTCYYGFVIMVHIFHYNCFK